MNPTYRSLLGYEENAKKIHIHLTEIKIESESDRKSHYEHSHHAAVAWTRKFLQGRARARKKIE